MDNELREQAKKYWLENKRPDVSPYEVMMGFYEKGYDKGWKDATTEACIEIRKNYKPITHGSN